MNYIFYVEIKHRPKYKTGAYRRVYVPFTARSPINALRQAAKYCVDKGIEAVGFDSTWEGIPSTPKGRFKWMKERRLAEQNAKDQAIQNYIDFKPEDYLA